MGILLRSLRVLPAALVLLAAGCGGSDKWVSGTKAVYLVPASLTELSGETFFDHPWPSDLRLEDGSPRFLGYYNPEGSPLLDVYIETAHGSLDGFSPAASGFLRFTGPIDEGTLPATPRDALDPSSSVQLIDIDPSSPERGERKLVSLRWREAKGIYYQPNTLAFMPTVGFPLRPRTRYALVVTDALQAETGGAIAQQAELAEVVGAEPFDAKTRAANQALAPAVAALEEAGVPRGSVVHLAVFTTADPTKELMLVRDALLERVHPPKVTEWELKGATDDFDEYVGRYGPTPNFQAGTMPFLSYGEGGGFEFEDGEPVLQGEYDVRFSLAVPRASKCPPPPDGYPIVLYAHGTGGDYESYIYDGTAQALAQQCLVSMGVDQIFQGTRPGSPPDGSTALIDLTFFNFQNPVAARTNGRQAALDEVQRARLFTESSFTVPASVSLSHEDIELDADRLMFFGHSQGGLNGPLFTAIDPTARGAVYSGSGALLVIALLEKTEPAPSPAAMVRVMLGLNADDTGELDMFHPTMSLAQSLIDTVDTIHYARLQATEPREGFAPKSVYMPEGIDPDGVGDSYAPPHAIEAHAIAMGLPPQAPLQHAITELQWGGAQEVTVPPEGLSGNLGEGKASGVLGQWAVPPGSDGHFVVFDVPQARAQAARFLRNLADDPAGRVPPP